VRNRFILYLLCQLFSIAVVAQVDIKGRISDAEDGSSLAFCSIAIKGTSKGCLANEDGYFLIKAASNDVLIVYSLGYERKEIPVSALMKNNSIKLKQIAKELGEVIVYAEDDRLYELLVRCRKNIVKAKKLTSKAYFQLTTKSNKEPVEMLECYYNATTKGSAIEELKLKNGRAGLAGQNDRYFVSFNTSRAISYLDLVKENEFLPSLPLQFGKRNMKKRYNLRLISEDEYNYNISFLPKRDNSSYFSGEIWIDKKTALIQKIQLNCPEASVHPFVAFAEDTLKKVSLYITHSYAISEGESRLSHVNFNYTLWHKSIRNNDSSIQYRAHDLPEREIRTAGIIYFYDPENSFTLPFYEYNQYYTDFRKISLIPYNPDFWNNSTGLLFTEEQKRTIEFLEKNGSLINFNNVKMGKYGIKGFFETNNHIWTDSTRINYERNVMIPGRSQSVTNVKIAAQVYLDVNEVNGKTTYFSATVFDAMNSYAPEPIEPVTKCFMNIYFDIYEIERRKMEQRLSIRSYSTEEIKNIHEETLRNIKKVIGEYTSEVNLGKNIEALKQWNEYCRRELGFDNMRIFEVEAQ
jgi:hypothetical protein